jgi:hypothetical protein
MTVTATPDTTTVVDVDLDAVLPCQAADNCVGDLGPAVTRMHAVHACSHTQQALICAECTSLAARYLNRWVGLTCGVCGAKHSCIMSNHVTLSAL